MTAEMSGPVCLIENTRQDKLVVRQEALDILTSIQQPVVVVSIVGLYRTGKSYLMNRLAQKRSGFSLGSTIQSETKGIWMWCVPHPLRKGCQLVLLDTEGLGDVEKGDQVNDAWIFALAVLLSSTLIYNSQGVINNDAINNLEYVTELTQRIKVKSSLEREDETEAHFVDIFPSFIWTVRDFTLKLELRGQPVTADEYLENSIQPLPGNSKQVVLNNAPRLCLRSYFPSRKCFVFPLPVPPEQLEMLDKLSDKDLVAEFVQRATEFCTYVYANSKEKKLSGDVVVTGAILGQLVQTYVETIRSGQVPCLENAVKALAQIQNSKAVEEAEDVYVKLMETRVVLHTESEVLLKAHESCMKEALQYFRQHSFKDDDQHYEKELKELMHKEYTRMCRRNEELSSSFCSDLLMLVWDKVDPDAFMKPGGYEEYQKQLCAIKRQYDNTPGKGIMAGRALEMFLEEKVDLGEVIREADVRLSEQEEELLKEKEHAREANLKADEAHKQKKSLEKKLEKAEVVNERLENKLGNIEEKCETLEEKLLHEKQVREEERKKVDEQKAIAQQVKAEAEEAKNKVKSMEEKLEKVQEKMEQEKKEREEKEKKAKEEEQRKRERMVVTPGLSLTRTSVQEISRSMESCRNVTLAIYNYTHSIRLTNPEFYLDSGECFLPPHATIQPLTVEACAFCHCVYMPAGSAGVLTYDICGTNPADKATRLAVMFSVPFDYTFWTNWFAVGEFETCDSCDKYLFDKMYNKSGPFKRLRAKEGTITFKCNDFVVNAVMTTKGVSILNVELRENA